MPRTRIIPRALTPQQVAVQRHYMKGLLPRNLGFTTQGGRLGFTTQGGRLGDVTNGAGYVNNYWPGATVAKVPYVLTFDRLGSKLGPRALQGLRGGNGNGTIVIPSPSCPNGSITDEDGNLLGCQGPNGEVQPTETGPAISIPGGVSYQSAAGIVPGNNGIVATLPAATPPPPQPTAWDQVTSWLSQPVSPGSSIKIGHLVAGAGLLGLIAAKKQRRR